MVAPVAVPPSVNTMLVIELFIHNDGETIPDVKVMVCDCTVILPVAVPIPQPPLVVTV